MDDAVLILTRHDTPVDAVASALADHGCRAVVLPTDDVPARVGVALLPDGGVRIRDPRGVHDLHRPRAVWYRRMGCGDGLPPGTDDDVRRAVHAESRALILGLLDHTGAWVLGPKSQLDHAAHKPRQLALAAEVGLDVPATLCTTDPAAVRRFARRHRQGLVTKVFTSFAVGSRDAPQVVMTTAVAADALARFDDAGSLRSCPATFQELVPKERELRVTLVGRQAFVSSIDTTGVPEAAVDWRRGRLQLADRWQPDELPSHVLAGLHRLMDRLGLDYGAADVIRTPDGRWVFLELNPAGEYLWLDSVHEGAISREIAALLAGDRPRRSAG